MKHINRNLSIHPRFLADFAETLDATSDKKYRDLLSAVENAAVPTALPWQKDIEEGSVALHYIQGFIYAKDVWRRFTTQEFMDDIRLAEANDNVIAHVLVVDSPGGEVFYLHEAFELLRSCSKPVLAVCEDYLCSGAYWLACAARKVYAVSKISTVGSIGAMSVLYDESGWNEKMGLKEVELYSSKSPLKNKRTRDARDGKTGDYVKDVLDPIAELFISDVQSVRKGIPEDSDALKGQTYYAEEAASIGLIDGLMSIEDVIAKAAALAAGRKKPKPDINQLNISI